MAGERYLDSWHPGGPHGHGLGTVFRLVAYERLIGGLRPCHESEYGTRGPVPDDPPMPRVQIPFLNRARIAPSGVRGSLDFARLRLAPLGMTLCRGPLPQPRAAVRRARDPSTPLAALRMTRGRRPMRCAFGMARGRRLTSRRQPTTQTRRPATVRRQNRPTRVAGRRVCFPVVAGGRIWVHRPARVGVCTACIANRKTMLYIDGTT